MTLSNLLNGSVGVFASNKSAAFFLICAYRPFEQFLTKTEAYVDISSLIAIVRQQDILDALALILDDLRTVVTIYQVGASVFPSGLSH